MLTLEAFGQRIKALRTAQGLSQQQLADLIYVTRKTVGNWETGNRIPDLTMLSRLAECLGVETYVLYKTAEKRDEADSDKEEFIKMVELTFGELSPERRHILLNFYSMLLKND